MTETTQEMIEALTWYAEMAKLAQRATLQLDNQAALHVLKEMALDGGKRAIAILEAVREVDDASA